MNIKKIANDFISDVALFYDMEMADVTAEDIAKFCSDIYHFEIVYYSFNKLRQTVAGTTYITKDAVVIGINSRMSRKRQLFTIMHELGHILMHSDTNAKHQSFSNLVHNMGYSKKEQQQEKEADLFASFCMLNDAALLKHTKDLPSFAQLSNKFNISDAALNKRIIYRLLEIPKVYDLERAQKIARNYRYKDYRKFLEILQKNF